MKLTPDFHRYCYWSSIRCGCRFAGTLWHLVVEEAAGWTANCSGVTDRPVGTCIATLSAYLSFIPLSIVCIEIKTKTVKFFCQNLEETKEER